MLLLFAERLDHLDQCCNPQLQRLKIRVMGYNFYTQWIKGALNGAPDALSRHPVSDSLPLDLHAERDPGNDPDVTIADIRAMCCSQESLRLHELRRHAEEDIVVFNNFAIASLLGSLNIGASFLKYADLTGVSRTN